VADPVAADLRAGQPKDTRENPVAVGLRNGQGTRIDLPGRTAPTEDGADRFARPNLRANHVAPARGLQAAIALAGAVPGGGHRKALDQALVLDQVEPLMAQADPNTADHGVRSSSPGKPQG